MEKAEIKAIIKRLENHFETLTPYQVDLVKGLKKYHSRYNKLSAKQIDALISIDNLVYAK